MLTSEMASTHFTMGKTYRLTLEPSPMLAVRRVIQKATLAAMRKQFFPTFMLVLKDIADTNCFW